MNWNIRGLNDDAKQQAVRAKIEESTCSVFCIQETKMMHVDCSIMKKIAPKRFNKFSFVPSVGASGGILVGWVDAVFQGTVKEINDFAITVNFQSRHNAEKWNLTTVYGPCQGEQRDNFVDWLYNLEVDPDKNWLFVGDFNFYRSLENRNRDGANVNDMNIFNAIISNLGLVEIPLKGRQFTWSNMQEAPLLEQLDWCFTSPAWSVKYPSTLLLPMSKPTSDHIPCIVQIGTRIPKAKVFRFENYWMQHPGFMEIVQAAWNIQVRAINSASRIAAKFKNLRRVLRRWSKGISRLSNLINKCNDILLIMDKLEKQRNFRNIIKNHIARLLKYKN